MERRGAVGAGHRGGGGIPAVRTTPYGLRPGIAPVVLTAAIGGWNATAGLGDPAGSGQATAVFLVTLAVTAAAAASLSAMVRAPSIDELPVALLVVAATYLAAVAGHRAGPISAGVVGLALLGLAHLVHSEIRVQRRLPAQTLAWTWQVTLAVTVASAALDAVVAVVAGGGKPRPGGLSTLSVVVACVVVTAVTVGVTALVHGVRVPESEAAGSVPL